MEMDAKIWATVDGRRYTSVPTEVPTAWKQKQSDTGLIYVGGDYRIVRMLGSTGHRYYWVYRSGVELPLAFYGRLMDAKDRAVKNAEGRDVMNVA